MGRGKYTEFSTGPVGGTMTTHRVHPAAQCPSKHWMGGERCQGVRGHKGPHWCYRSDGWLEQWQQKKDIKGPWDWASQTTPPDHKGYVHPKDKQKEHHRNFDKWEVVGTFEDKEPPLSKRKLKRLDWLVKKIKQRSRRNKKA